MASKQGDTISPSHAGNTTDNFNNDTSGGHLADNERLYNEGNVEVSVCTSANTVGVKPKENQALYVDRESVDSEDTLATGIYVADNIEAKNDVTYQLNNTCREELSANVYECEEDIDDTTENSDATNTDTEETQPENVINNDRGEDEEPAHNTDVNDCERISPYAVAYSQYGCATNRTIDQRNLNDDFSQPYAVTFDEQDDHNASPNTSPESDGDLPDGLRANPMYVPNTQQSPGDADNDGLRANPMYAPNAAGGRICILPGARMACMVTTCFVVGALVVLVVLLPVIFKAKQPNEDSDMKFPHHVPDKTTAQSDGTQLADAVTSPPSTVAGLGNNENELVKQFVFGGQGTKPGYFCGPYDVVVSPSNEIFVTDTFSSRVQVFSMKGTYLRHFATVVSEDESDTMQPGSITIDADCHLWVSGNNNDSTGYVVQYTETGRRIRTLHASFPNNTFGGIAVDLHHNHVVVAENWRDYTEVKVLLFDGTVVRKFGKVQTDHYSKTQVAMDTEGNIFVSDCHIKYGGWVNAYNESGQYLFSFGEAGSYIESVGGVCVDSSGHVFVSYGDDTRVELYTNHGVHIRSIHVVSNMTSADGVAVGPDGQLLVTSVADDLVLVLPHY
uniref:SMP-30/Gluconolactonase/LRE-like region domain-containing protein n=1 Tax=Branchiostoma floridae TaxID=7739 RepID=C3ZH36_BRAFL|eukprot:XP_002592172.1 hypothetical protein BRAFLDRAFT_88104 [Branchiostoma floridae]